jgi:iron complex outermembrane receptor protein
MIKIRFIGFSKEIFQTFILVTVAMLSTTTPLHAQGANISSADNESSGLRKSVGKSSLEEVIVTARRRRESLQETPIAVSALTGEEMRDRGLTSISELTKSVPSVEILESTSNVIYIRGIGQRSAYARVDPTVGVYLDNIFLPRADGQLLDTIDIENVQVLRGPQGTLFGKNTTGGAMVLTLEKPHENTEGYIFGALGNYGRHQFRGGVNLPISDTLFTRFALNYLKDDGYIKDASQNETNNSRGRTSFISQLRWEANANVLVDSLLYVGKIDERLPSTYCTPINTEDAVLVGGLYLLWEGDTDPSNPRAYKENCEKNSKERLGDLKTNTGDNSYLDRSLDTYLFGTTVEMALSDDTSLKVVLGARDETIGPIISSDQDGGPMNFNESFNTKDGERSSYSLEIQLSGELFSERLTYTAGIFGMIESNTEEFVLTNALNGVDATTLAQIGAGQKPTRPTPRGTLPLVGIFVDPIVRSGFELESQTLAAFAQASWDITDNLELTFGARWTEETRRSDLEVRSTDRDAIAQRILLSGLGFAPAAEGFHAYAGPLGWAADPIGLAMSLFPDANGDGLNDFPESPEPLRIDKKEQVFRKTTPMMSMSYQMPSHILPAWLNSTMIYGTWSSGFKSGFFEPKGVDGLSQIEPEEVENREIGIKIDAFDRTLRLNMAFYDMDFDNQQLIQVDTDSNNNLVVIYQNAGQSEIQGAELELQWMPTAQLMISFSASDNNYGFTSFKDNSLIDAALGRQVLLDRSDEPFPVSPETTIAVGIQYSFPLDSGLLTGRLDYSYKSDIYYGLDDGSYTVYQKDKDLAGQPAFELFDGRVTWANNEQDLTLTVFVKNILDERYNYGVAAVGDSVATYFQAYGEPRRYGLEIRKTF